MTKHRNNNNRTLTSRCLGESVNGPRATLVKYYEKLAYNTRDVIDQQTFWQHAEHYKRMEGNNGQRNN